MEMLIERRKAYVILAVVFLLAVMVAVYAIGPLKKNDAPQLILGSQAKSEALNSYAISYTRDYRYLGEDGKPRQALPSIVVKRRKGQSERWDVIEADGSGIFMYRTSAGIFVCTGNSSVNCTSGDETQMREFLYYSNPDTLAKHVSNEVIDFGPVTNSSVKGRPCDGFTGKINAKKISESDLNEFVFGSFITKSNVNSVGDVDFWVCYDRETGIKSELLVGYFDKGRRAEAELQALEITPNAELGDELFRVPA